MDRINKIVFSKYTKHSNLMPKGTKLVIFLPGPPYALESIIAFMTSKVNK